MHEPIDDYEPDLSSYYNMDPEKKKLIKQLEYWQKKYYSGKISYEKYIEGLKGFKEILTLNEWAEIEDYEKEKLRNKKSKNQHQSNENKSNAGLGCVGLIILFIIWALIFK